MLLNALKKHFKKHLDSRPILVWFDPEGDFQLLLDDISAAGLPLTCIQTEGQLIRLRADLLYQPAPTIIYLPWKRDADESDLLTPILPLAHTFTDSLFRFLNAQNVSFPDDPKTKGPIKDVLPRLAKQSLGKGSGYWKKVLSSLDAVREELLGDYAEKLLSYLAVPTETQADLEKNNIENFFFGLLASRYGFECDPASEIPEAIARRLTAHFILARAWLTAGRPDDFPYRKLLPPIHLLNDCDSFLRRWQDSSFAAAFNRLAAQIEPQYSLKKWANALPLDISLSVGAIFQNIENTLWARIENEIKNLDTDAAWLGFLSQHQDAISARKENNYWVKTGHAPHWDILTLATLLFQSVQTFETEIDHISDANQLVQRYANSLGWWRIDHAYREFRQAIGDATGSYDQLRQRIGRTYHRFLERLNNRFAELLTGRQKWDLDALPAQTNIWNELVKVRKGQRTAVIFVDALRLELAHALVERLQRDIDPNDLSLNSRLVTLPSVTEVCMPALLPGGDTRQIDYKDGWQVTIDKSRNLAVKAERIAYLRSKYSKIQVYNELSELLKTPSDQIPGSAELYVTFHTALDSIGEEAHELALPVFREVLKDVEQAIRKFRAAEIAEIHIITDHGFLLLDDISESNKVPAKDVPAFKKSSRYLVGRNLGHTDQLRFPIPGAEGLEGWFARGIGVFRTPGKYNYTHGGLSLQEVVIPCLTVSQKSSGGMIEVEMSAPDEIRGKLLKVKVQALSAELLARPRQVELHLEKISGGTAPIVSISQVIEMGDEIEIKVLLPNSAPLEIGEQVIWLLVDAVSGHVLQEQPAVNRMDFF
jgi:hypothetical protein